MGELYEIKNIQRANKINLNTSLVTASTVSAYSLGVQYMREWFISKFPKDFFKAIKIEGRHTLYDFKRLTRNDLISTTKPSLYIEPQLQADYNREFVDSYPYGANMYAMHCNHHASFFKDYENNLYVGLIPETMRIDVNFRIRLATKAQQLDWYKFMHLAFRIGYSQAEHVSMDFHIPYRIMINLAKDAGFKIKDDTIVDIPKFLSYVNSHTELPVTYKLRTINAKDEFFLRMNSVYTKIKCEDEIDVDDGEKAGMTNTNYILSMKATLDLPCPKMYAYFSKIEHTFMTLTDDKTCVGVYNVRTYDIPNTNSNGWNILLTTEFYEKVDDTPLKIDFSSFFKGTEMEAIIDYNNDIELSSSCFIDFLLLNGDDTLSYHMDWKTLMLTTSTAPTNNLTTIGIYVDRNYVNRLRINTGDVDKNRMKKDEE